ncbi:hypothetical protein N9878_01030 [bacterium]|nr:hypothetical protein [bacterium]
MRETTPSKILDGQWGSAMNYIETHNEVLIKSRDHHDIVMVLASDYKDMRLELEQVKRLNKSLMATCD